MSRGHGKIQRLCLDVLSKSDTHLDSLEVAGRALDKNVLTDSEDRSVRRALRKLADKGLVIDLGRGWQSGRRHWASPEVAKEHMARLQMLHGADC